MRLRRETGDFSIKLTINEETHELNDVWLPKGLSAEDLFGVAIKMPSMGMANNTMLRAITMVIDFDNVLGIPLGENPQSGMLYYDRTTGILTASQVIIATEYEAASKEPMFSGNITDLLVDDVVKLIVGVEGSSVPVGTYEGTVTRVSTLPQDYTAAWDHKSALIPKGYRSIGISYSVNGVSKTVDLYGSPNGTLIGHPAYVGQRQTI